jgi:GT2 family glycosyltransferase/glycosyltransferase involved in cell wall biosynthesis
MGEPVHGAASPEAAWRNGVEAARIGDFGQALHWLERAARLRRDDPRIAIDLANIRLYSGRADQLDRAAAAFETLCLRYDVAGAWLGLLAARRLQGEHARAAQALADLLSRHCVPEELGFTAVAAAVAVSAGRPGWCGIDAAGLLHIAASGEVQALVDGAPAVLSSGAAAPDGREMTLMRGGAMLLGSPLNLAALRRCEGIVEALGATLTGWVSRPAAPLQPPRLFLMDANGTRRKIAVGGLLPADADAPLTPRYGFACPISMLLDLTPPFRVTGPDGADIFGSPLNLQAEFASPLIPAGYLGPANRVLPARAELRVVVPVYRGLAVTQACLAAALQALPPHGRLIVVDDASPEPALQAWLDAFCGDPRIRLIRHASNLGFPAAANAGLEAAVGCDVLLLNSDTLLPARALQTLLAAVYSRADIGSATPFSNEATICSYPDRKGGNAAPDLDGTIALDAMAAKANRHGVIEIPTGVGFCLLMRHDCIARTGLLRAGLFAQGYGEEVDWCLRARHRGYRHVAATGAFVAHQSRVSFGAAGRALNLRNNRLLMRLHPGYKKLIEAHFLADPLAPARRQLDAMRFRANRRKGAVLLISHNQGGGVARRIAAEMRDIRKAGQRPILLCPAPAGDAPAQPFPSPAALTDGGPGDYPNLRFALPAQTPELLALLRAEHIGHAVLHHGLGHHPTLRKIAEELHCPQDIVVHDYASFCPRVHLIGPEQRYCGEPSLASCTACVASAGDATAEGLGPQKLWRRSAREFAAARRIIAPSADASRRIARHFPKTRPNVTPWEDDTQPLLLTPPGTSRRRIAVLGGIGRAKGYDILLECGRDAALRNLPLDFVLAGASADDEPLLETGRIFITGAYKTDELPALLAGLQANLAFIPSIWPETWCFTLSEAWAAGLYTLAFDIGAQAERIAATQRGGLLPLGLPARRVNDALLTWRPNYNLELQ